MEQELDHEDDCVRTDADLLYDVLRNSDAIAQQLYEAVYSEHLETLSQGRLPARVVDGTICLFLPNEHVLEISCDGGPLPLVAEQDHHVYCFALFNPEGYFLEERYVETEALEANTSLSPELTNSVAVEIVIKHLVAISPISAARLIDLEISGEILIS